jgi:diguanylate cyclase (GGDEF)-like protein/PAS domain S-box-containing protein
MPGMIPSAFLMASSALIVVAIFLYIYYQYRERYMMIWAIASLGFGLGPIFYLLSLRVISKNIGVLAEEFAFLGSSVLLFWGIFIFMDMKYPRWVNYGFILTGCIIIYGNILHLPFTAYTLPAFLLIAGLFFQSGIVLFRNRRHLGTSGTIGGWALIIASFNLLDYPFIKQNNLGALGYMMGAICIAAIAIGMLLFYFQKFRRDLSHSETRYRFMAENARDMVYRLQTVPELKYEFINGAAFEITGYTPDEFYKNPKIIFNIVHPNYKDITRQLVSGTFDYSQKVTLPWIHRDGHTVWIEQHIHTITDNHGKVITLEGIARNITEKVQIEEKLTLLSMKDSLTGIYNRTFFEQACQNFDSENYNPLGMILCDIDGLKLINDTLGHDAGDALLTAATWAIQQSFRDNDVIARIGGDEFAILLPKTPLPLVEKSVKRIENFIQKYNESEAGAHLSMSVGFAFRNDCSIRMVELFKTADNNMYREKLYRSQSVRSNIVNTLRKALEARDFITEGHTERLQDLVIKLAIAIGFPENRLTDLRLFAQFHDIGKVGIPDRVLFKPGKLTDEEKKEMHRHSEIGYRIAQSSPDLVVIADWVLRHHEWWDGSGYPLKLKGEEIPLECRILAIVDAYDAMVNDRPYRKALSRENALAELRIGAGVQFDPDLVEEFINLGDPEQAEADIEL